METAAIYRDGRIVGEREVVGAGDSSARHGHAEKEYLIDLRASKGEVEVEDVIWAGGLNGWEVVATRVIHRKEGSVLRCAVKTALRPELPLPAPDPEDEGGAEEDES